MSTTVVFQQMVVIFVLMMTGYYLTRKSIMSDITAKEISAIIVNVCNPALLLTSAFDDTTSATNKDLLIMAAITFVSYAFLILLAQFMGRVLRAPKSQYKFYNMMTVFANTGFIGIPVVAAVFGQGAVIYTAIYNIGFNICMYTYGIHTMTRDDPKISRGNSIKMMINPGTVAGVLALIVFILKIPVPKIISEGCSYMGRATTFLSMIVLGASLARMKWSQVFGELRLYPFLFIRLLVVPVASAYVLKPLVSNKVLLGVAVLLLAMPMANLPLMIAQQYGLETDTLSKGIVLSTILSLVTITITAFFI